ncbi:HEPN domain-containing protein [Candidatus Micrarchaeota archaeon]|nr:HEPN domain-containing protein [Candidatus Micrarchaeota archaeon]
MSVQTALEKGHLQRIPPDRELAKKEFREAVADLNTAKKALRLKDFKWSIVSSYYAMFHAARGLLFLNGLRERAHYAVRDALSEFAEQGAIKKGLPDDFAAAMNAREGADYRYTYSEETARQVLGIAEEFTAELVTRKTRNGMRA